MESQNAQAPRQRVISHVPDTEVQVAAIQRMRDKDVQASTTLDFEGLFNLFTADAVTMSPGADFVRTAEQRRAGMEGMRKVMADFEILEYYEDFEELRIYGQDALEWGVIRGKERQKSTGKIIESRYKVMRLLERQPDGEWKISRTIFNS